MASPAELLAMRRALDLAASDGAPLGPNPRVGCVLIDDTGQVVGEGYHRGAGTPHAEVVALAAAGPAARDATAVVTLEPCAHTGRTPPCTEALLEAGVGRVVFAQPDLNPIASGGAERLRTAGLDVEGGVLADQARLVNPEWSFAMRHRRPFVTWKLAATLDGRVAAADGTSRWITADQARADVHAWRARCDAILVGTGTVVADDPQLTVRDGSDRPAHLQPVRVVMGTRPIPARARVLDDTAPSRVLPTHDPSQALVTLFGADVTHVYLEGGPRLAGAFVSADLVDRVIAYYAGRLLGDGPCALGPTGIDTLEQARTLAVREVCMVGADVRVIAERPGWEEE